MRQRWDQKLQYELGVTDRWQVAALGEEWSYVQKTLFWLPGLVAWHELPYDARRKPKGTSHHSQPHDRLFLEATVL